MSGGAGQPGRAEAPSPHALKPDLDLRLVRYFACVVQHGHFGRAAAALHTSQPSLSRQVRRLEREVGAPLLDRSPRGVRLTEAGRAFMPSASLLLATADEAVERVRAASGATLTVGHTANLIVSPAIRALRAARADADVRTLHLAWDDARLALLSGRVDIAVARDPVGREGLDVSVLYSVPRVLVVPRGHRLAGAASVTLADFAHEPLPRVQDPAWDAFWRIDPRPDGSRAPDGPVVTTLEDKLELIASGGAVCIAPAGDRDAALRSDVVAVPIDGVESSDVVTAARASDTNPLIAVFRELAAAHLPAMASTG